MSSLALPFEGRVEPLLFVIPAKAGIQFSLVLLATTASRPCVFSLAIHGERVTFSCLPKRK